MNNIKYIDIVKAKLKNYGYAEENIDYVAQKVIKVADSREVDVLLFLEKYFLNKHDSETEMKIRANVNAYRNGTSFISKRVTSTKPNRFINRQIIDK